MRSCPGAGLPPVDTMTDYVMVNARGEVLARMNEYAARQFGTSETRAFGACSGCSGWFEFPGGGVRFHHVFG